ncbi:MAG: hypothetical protein A2X56_08485 [Nitrospirae bacterium GWC2_57_13]|jgi:radical SAM protein with 4Fe4S-binding SPASM domain|nr:MAG: hypothetical protein A2X56_08485 [Nitrospirae bacterium GWC2_57_13]OGW42616.1 MAG: hypothetical protein A2X57_00925 [Nitrospirae bacterium GWD2_57_8]HAR46494.1 radical SAM protein [Nitrospiraceae bacterium]
MSSCSSRVYGSEFTREEIDTVSRDGGLLSMEVEFNSVCNFRCLYCYAANQASPDDELTVDEFKDVILQAKALGARKIIILGGEPMLYPHILEMIRFIHAEGLAIEMFTNGANITADAARELYKNRVVVALKMNTFDEKVQDLLSGRSGAYRQIQDAFKNLKAAGYPKGCAMGMSTVICRQNLHELADMWVWLRDQGLTPYFEMITPQGSARRNEVLDVDAQEVSELFHAIARIDRERYGHTWEPQPPLVAGECRRHQFSCSLTARGDVQPCVGVTIPLGNVREQKLAEIIGESEVIEDLRNHRKTIKGPCGACEKAHECYGCRGAAYQSTGDYLASDPLCWKNADKQDSILMLPVRADGLLPHQPPMRIIERLLDVKERRSLSELTVTGDMIFAGESGLLDAAVYPEIISQALAAEKGFKSLGSGNGELQGVLLGVKNLEVLGAARVGDTLKVRVSKTARYGEFAILWGEVFRGEELMARGEIKVWHNGN